MKKLIVFAGLFIACPLLVGGCKSNQPTPAPAQNPAAPGGTLNSDGTVTPAPQQPPSQSPAQPPAQANSAPPPAPVTVTAPSGTRVQIRTTETLSASRNEVGDSFSGVLETPLIADGKTLFARGTRVTGTVVASKGRGRFKGAGDLGIELNTIAGIKVETNEYEREIKGKGKRTGGFIGGGAGLGALIGGLAGGGKGAVIGGLAGAGAGTAGAAYTGNKDVVLPSESLVTFHLSAPFTVTK
jgi:hypothetical protein